MLLKTDSIMIRVNEMLSNAQKAELNHRKREKKNEVSKKRETSKTQSANLMNMMIDDLIRKMKALVLQISIMSEVVINQTRVLMLQKLCDALMSAFSEVSRLKCFDYDKSDHNTIHYFSINVMCEKKL